MERYTKLDCLIDLRRRILSTELKPGHDLDEARLSDYYLSLIHISEPTRPY